MNKINIYDNIEYSDKKVQITPLFESNSSKEIRIVFKKDQIMKEHQTKFPITVEIFEGSIDFGVSGEVHTLVKGDIVALEGSVKHDLKATQDSIVRLSLSKGDSVARVNGVLKL